MSDKCFFNCGASLRSKYEGNIAERWLWFTGYADKTIHFCPDCIKYKYSSIDRLKQLTEIKPDDYPKTKVRVTTPEIMLGVKGA